MSDSRAEFEAAMRADGFRDEHLYIPVTLNIGGEYGDDIVQCRWEGWQLARATQPVPVATQAEAVASDGGAYELWESLRGCIAFSPKDWSIEMRDAWMYGIVMGWDGEALTEVAAKHGWPDGALARLRRIHSAFMSLRSAAVLSPDQPRAAKCRACPAHCIAGVLVSFGGAELDMLTNKCKCACHGMRP
jgi:hypothetical protein